MNYIKKETTISCVISAAMSALFFVIFFYNSTEFVLGEINKFTLDFFPQGFFIGVFSILPVTLVTYRRLKSGKINSNDHYSTILPKPLWQRVIVGALFSCLVFGGGATLISVTVLSASLSFILALTMKIVFGVVPALLITPYALKATFAHWRD